MNNYSFSYSFYEIAMLKAILYIVLIIIAKIIIFYTISKTFSNLKMKREYEKFLVKSKKFIPYNNYVKYRKIKASGGAVVYYPPVYKIIATIGVIIAAIAVFL